MCKTVSRKKLIVVPHNLSENLFLLQDHKPHFHPELGVVVRFNFCNKSLCFCQFTF